MLLESGWGLPLQVSGGDQVQAGGEFLGQVSGPLHEDGRGVGRSYVAGRCQPGFDRVDVAPHTLSLVR